MLCSFCILKSGRRFPRLAKPGNARPRLMSSRPRALGPGPWAHGYVAEKYTPKGEGVGGSPPPSSR